MMKIIAICSLLLASLLVGRVQAEQLNIAVASNFIQPMSQLVTEFEKQTGHSVRVSYASSGKLYAQIKHGAPFDLFFSADREKPLSLVGENLALYSSFTSYAVGQLALYSSTLDTPKLLEQALLNGRYLRLAIADEKLAPYGLAAKQSMQSLGVYEKAKSKLITGENINQTYQYVYTGNAELGFVAFAQVNDKKNVWLVPSKYHDPIVQSVVIIASSKKQQLATRFLAFVTSNTGQAIVKSHGFLFDETEQAPNL